MLAVQQLLLLQESSRSNQVALLQQTLAAAQWQLPTVQLQGLAACQQQIACKQQQQQGGGELLLLCSTLLAVAALQVEAMVMVRC
jgi:hypothetical protein